MRDRPPELAQALARLEDAVAPIRSRASRVQADLASRKPGVLDPEVLAQLARAERAPAELKAVARAVDEGRTTWQQVAAGETSRVPEVNELYRASFARVRRLVRERDEAAEAEERRLS